MSSFPRAFSHYRPRSHKVYGAIVVTADNEILLVRGKKTGIWSFPKGHLFGGETGQQCALRELKEETGIDLLPYRFFDSKKLFAGEYFFYRVDAALPTSPRDPNEISETGWFHVEEFSRLHCNADIMNFLTKVRRGHISLELNSKIDTTPIYRSCTQPDDEDDQPCHIYL